MYIAAVVENTEMIAGRAVNTDSTANFENKMSIEVLAPVWHQLINER